MNIDILFVNKTRMLLMLPLKDRYMYSEMLFSKYNKNILNKFQQLIQSRRLLNVFIILEEAFKNMGDQIHNNLHTDLIEYIDLINDDYSNIEDHETQHKETNQNNSVYTLVEHKLQSSSQLEDQNETNDWKTINKHEGGLGMAYDNNPRSNTLYPRSFYALHIRPNNNGASHLIF